MATETKIEQHLRLRGAEPKKPADCDDPEVFERHAKWVLRGPSIVRHPPTINDVPDAIDKTTMSLERLRVLFASPRNDLHELVMELPGNGGAISEGQVDRLFNLWIIFEVVAEKLGELEETLGSINEKAHADLRVAA